MSARRPLDGRTRVRELRNGRVALALHERKGGDGPALLLLHALAGSSRDWGMEVDLWPGPVFALDFSGHGASGWRRGGSYHIEHFVSDADVALAEIGSAALAGAGVGAWYALLLAGARADRVPAVLLAPGRGLAGGGPAPDPLDVRRRIPNDAEVAAFAGDCDPYVLGSEGMPHPPRFTEPFARAARRVLLVEDGAELPPWWVAVREAGGERAGADLATGLAALAEAAREASG